MRKRILVVESQPDLAILLRLAFEQSGLTVLLASNLSAARSVVSRRWRLHLVVLDMVLPDGDALEFCRQLKARRPTLAVLALTDREHDHGFRREVLEGCADLLFTKPFQTEKLRAAALRLLERPHGESPPA